jgi:hypothetical protein
MPITLIELPSSTVDVLKGQLRSLLSSAETATALIGAADPRRLVAAVPHMVYTVGLDAIRAGRLLSAATGHSFRCLLMENNIAVGDAELGPLVDDGELRVYRIGNGPLVAGTLDALQKARLDTRLSDGDYEPRMLMCPSVYFAALWLHGPQDYVLPLSSPTPALTMGHFYVETEITEPLAAVAFQTPTLGATPSNGDVHTTPTKHPRTDSLPLLSQAYFLGQGFDVSGTYSIPASLILPILDPDKVGTREFEFLGHKYRIPAYASGAENTSGYFVEDTVDTRESFQNSIAATASVEVGYGAFGGQMEASYGRSVANSSEFHYSYRNFYSRLAIISLLRDQAIKALSDEFIARYEALPNKADGSTLDQFAEFFNDFGIYVTSQLNLGAALEYYVAVSQSAQLSKTDIGAQVKVQYKSLYSTGAVSSDIETTQQWQKYRASSSVNIVVRGGDPSIIAKMGNVDPQKPSTTTVAVYTDWINSIVTAPAVADFKLQGIWQLIPDLTKSRAVKDAVTMLKVKMRPRLVIQTSSRQSQPPTITLGAVIRPSAPPKYPIGYQIVMLDRDDVSVKGVRFNRYYGVPEASWYDAYERMYDEIAMDIQEGGFQSTRNILVLASYGMSRNAPPNSSLYPLLRSFGGGSGLLRWLEQADAGSSMYRYPCSYVLAGIGALGPDTGAEMFLDNEKTIQQEVFFYRQRGSDLYTLSVGSRMVGQSADGIENSDVRRAFSTLGRDQVFVDPIA